MERRAVGDDHRGPTSVHGRVGNRDEVVSGGRDLHFVEGRPDHGDPLARSEGVIQVMAFLRAADDDDQLVSFIQNGAKGFQVTEMKGLKPPHKERALYRLVQASVTPRDYASLLFIIPSFIYMFGCEIQPSLAPLDPPLSPENRSLLAPSIFRYALRVPIKHLAS